MPELGFMFPCYEDGGSNIYSCVYYTKDAADSHGEFVDGIFGTRAPMPAKVQKEVFEALLGDSLQDECSLEVVQTVHEQLCQSIDMHKESKVADPLLISKEQVKGAIEGCGVSEEHLAKFSVAFDETFGTDAQLHPKKSFTDN